VWDVVTGVDYGSQPNDCKWSACVETWPSPGTLPTYPVFKWTSSDVYLLWENYRGTFWVFIWNEYACRAQVWGAWQNEEVGAYWAIPMSSSNPWDTTPDNQVLCFTPASIQVPAHEDQYTDEIVSSGPLTLERLS
jgi:hypothetical protein